MPTDRSLLKQAQIGHVSSSGLSDPRVAVREAHEESFTFATIAAADHVESGIVMVKACRVKSIRIVAATTLAAHASNNITCTVAKRDGAGGSATSIGAVTTDVAGGALTAFTPKTVSLTASAVNIAAGGVLTFKTVDNGTTTEPLMTCTVTVEYV